MKYGKIMSIYGTSTKINVCPDPVWKPSNNDNNTSST